MKVLDATVLLTPSLMAMALRVVVSVKVRAPLYTALSAVGVLPSVV